jgi:hypothetical protein
MGKLQSLKIVFSKALDRGFEKTNQEWMVQAQGVCNRLVTAGLDFREAGQFAPVISAENRFKSMQKMHDVMPRLGCGVF